MDFLQLDEIAVVLVKNTGEKFKGWERRIFMAEVVRTLGPGGQRKAERELGWNRCTIRKGLKEPESGIIIDNRSATGRKKAEGHLPDLMNDIKDIAAPNTDAPHVFITNDCSIVTSEAL